MVLSDSKLPSGCLMILLSRSVAFRENNAIDFGLDEFYLERIAEAFSYV